MDKPEEVKLPETAATAEVSPAAPKKRVPIKDLPEDQQRAYRREKTARNRKAEKELRSATARRSNSIFEISAKNAKEILLTERGLRNEHVADVCVELARVAASQNQIPFNTHLFTHGLRLTLAAPNGRKIDPPSNAVEEVEGEILHKADLYALYDYGFWRQPDATFEQWLADRRRLKSSAFELSVLLGKEDFGDTHKEWDTFLPRWNPQHLRPGYTQRQALEWLGQQGSDTEGDRKRFLLIASRNSMKALALDTIVQTPQGRRRIEDVHPGDQVLGEDGLPKLVVGESEIFTDRPCYKITFSTGETVVADGDHLWKTNHANGDTRADAAAKGQHARWHVARSTVNPDCPYCNGEKTFTKAGKRETSVVTTKQIADTCYYGKRQDYNHKINLAAPAQLDERAYLVAPYVLGAWLGDGSSADGRFTIFDNEIVSEIAAHEGEPHCYNNVGLHRFGTSRRGERGPNPQNLKGRLRQIGVLNNKHIPEEYFLGSVEQRFALLQGLMDTDGTCGKDGRSTFCNTSHRLIKDVQRLSCSLGFKACVCETTASLNGQPTSPVWFVSFTAYNDNPVFKIERKKNRQQPLKKSSHQNVRTIVSVEEVPSVPTKCLSVEDGMYLITDSYIPTHNSTFIRIHALCLTLCCPDSSVLLVSETNKLSRKSMKELKGYLEVASWNNPTVFQQYFSEYCIKPEDGEKLLYANPLAHLNLPQNSVESSSMESANTGSRFWYCIFDDPISRDNGTSNDEQKQAAISKYGSIMKLREPKGRAVSVQTPWVPGDLGEVMITQNDADPEHPLAVRIDPVFDIKKEARFKPLLELTEQDVTLNFLPKLDWRFVRDEMRSPEGLNFFKTQYLCQWVQEGEDLRLQFDHDELWARVRPAAFFTTPLIGTTTWMSIDRAWSTSRFADLTAIVVGRIQIVQNKMAMVIIDVKLERMRESDIVKASVEMIQKHSPTVLISEADKGMTSAQDMANAIRNGCLSRQVVPPYFRWLVAANTARSKLKKFKALEQPVSDGRLWFVNAAWTEQLLAQFERYQGLFKNSGSSIGSKDDGVDAVSVLWQEARSLHHKEERPAEEDVETRRREEEAELDRERLRMAHAAMFGGSNRFAELKNPTTEQPPEAPRPGSNEAARALMAKILPRGMRI